MKRITTAALGSIAAALLITNMSSASSLKEITASIIPFHWTVNGHAINNGDTFYNGKVTVPTSINYKGTTYLPVRVVAEELGLSVEWNEQSKQAVLVDATMDDPLGDQPYKAVEYSTWSRLKADADLVHEPGVNKKVLLSLKKGEKIKVLAEINRSWLKAASESGKTGYLPASSADYVLLANRPAWEQQADSIIAMGLKYIGTPYDFGAPLGETDRFDCSSYVNYLYGMHGIHLKRTSRDQSRAGTEITYGDARKGDLLFFTTPKRKDKTGTERIGHVAIYLGEGKMLHTFRVGIGVTVTEVDDSWKKRLVKATRLINL
ncbi:C40 family peptidase [Paenibacillus gansuensis]|uniref:NlpC/P60 family protein n=1 Tax=Paenibacillus gansuensis TaxID=306542 RepID=A0ABW5PCN0_9BACL